MDIIKVQYRFNKGDLANDPDLKTLIVDKCQVNYHDFYEIISGFDGHTFYNIKEDLLRPVFKELEKKNPMYDSFAILSCSSDCTNLLRTFLLTSKYITKKLVINSEYEDCKIALESDPNVCVSIKDLLHC